MQPLCAHFTCESTTEHQCKHYRKQAQIMENHEQIHWIWANAGNAYLSLRIGVLHCAAALLEDDEESAVKWEEEEDSGVKKYSMATPSAAATSLTDCLFSSVFFTAKYS